MKCSLCGREALLRAGSLAFCCHSHEIKYRMDVLALTRDIASERERNEVIDSYLERRRESE